MNDIENILNDAKPLIYKIANVYTSSEAEFEDLCQEIYIQVWQSLSAFKKESKLSTWIYRVCLNTALSYQKRETRRQTKLQEFAKNHSTDVDDSEKVKIDTGVQFLLDCIKSLKPIDKSIMLLYLEGLSHQEIAETLGISTSNVGSKVNRIKPKLLKCIKNKGYGR